MTREEAIEYWENLRKTFSIQLEHEEKHFGRMHLQTSIDAIDMAISAIRAQQDNSIGIEAIKPLTLEELRGMDGEPVWVRHRHGGEWVIAHWNAFDVIAESLHDVLFRHEYGKTWLAYHRKTEEEMV